MCSIFLFFHVNYLRVVKYFEMSHQVWRERRKHHHLEDHDDDSHSLFPIWYISSILLKGDEKKKQSQLIFNLFYCFWGLDWQWISRIVFFYFMTFSFHNHTNFPSLSHPASLVLTDPAAASFSNISSFSLPCPCNCLLFQDHVGRRGRLSHSTFGRKKDPESEKNALPLISWYFSTSRQMREDREEEAHNGIWKCGENSSGKK